MRDPHTGVIEREESRCAKFAAQVSRLAGEVRRTRTAAGVRERVREFEDRRERLQTDVNRLHREHVDRARNSTRAQGAPADAARRLAQLETGLADVRADLRAARPICARRAAAWKPPSTPWRRSSRSASELEQERERMRAELSAARAAAQAAQQQARELALQVESRRSSHAALTTTLSRIEKQLRTGSRRDELARSSIGAGRGAARARAIAARAGAASARAGRGELQAARIASDELDALLRERDAERAEVEQRVEAARMAPG
jgi:hypothetical protein